MENKLKEMIITDDFYSITLKNDFNDKNLISNIEYVLEKIGFVPSRLSLFINSYSSFITSVNNNNKDKFNSDLFTLKNIYNSINRFIEAVYCKANYILEKYIFRNNNLIDKNIFLVELANAIENAINTKISNMEKSNNLFQECSISYKFIRIEIIKYFKTNPKLYDNYTLMDLDSMFSEISDADLICIVIRATNQLFNKGIYINSWYNKNSNSIKFVNYAKLIYNYLEYICSSHINKVNLINLESNDYINKLDYYYAVRCPLYNKEYNSIIKYYNDFISFKNKDRNINKPNSIAITLFLSNNSTIKNKTVKFGMDNIVKDIIMDNEKENKDMITRNKISTDNSNEINNTKSMKLETKENENKKDNIKSEINYNVYSLALKLIKEHHENNLTSTELDVINEIIKILENH